VGLEPATSSDATSNITCGCVICPERRAARALQMGCSDWLELASLDGDLQRVTGAWDELPGVIRRAILALVGP
jgi:hypothetical protein